jgi:hypothetical protein
MNQESQPNPEVVSEAHEMRLSETEQAVVREVERLDVGLDLGRHLRVRERLAELGEHFADSVAMACIIETLFVPLKERLDLPDESPKRLMRAAVLHDIGKSGPAGERGKFHDFVRRLFITPERPFALRREGHDKTIGEFVSAQEMADKDECLATLREWGIDPDTEPAIEFWRRHAQWGYDVLRDEMGPDIDEDTVLIVATHHLLEGKNPAGLNLEEVPVGAHVIEVLEMAELMAAVDKYQAFRDRGHLDHERTVAALRKMVGDNHELSETAHAKFHAILDVLDGAKDEMEKLLVLDGKQGAATSG